MKSRTVNFFATASDLTFITDSVTSTCPLQFTAAGLFDQVPTASTTIDVTVTLRNYLVHEQGESVAAKKVRYRGDRVGYTIDQSGNPRTIALKYGGLIEPDHLVASQIGTIWTNASSLRLLSLFAGIIEGRFERIQSYYVGSSAVLLLDKGGRLTPTAKSPKAYDLVRPRS